MVHDGHGLGYLQNTARERRNVFEALMEAVKTHSLGQISHALYDVGGEYREGAPRHCHRNRTASPMTSPDPLQCTYADARRVHLRQGIALSTRAKVDFFEEMVSFVLKFGARDRLADRRVNAPDETVPTSGEYRRNS